MLTANLRRTAALGLTCLLASCLGGDGGSDDPDPVLGGLRIRISPATVVARHGESVTVRVDALNVAERDLPSGYAFDLDEFAGHIDVSTAPCPAREGTVACQDWTITPDIASVPGSYEVNVRTIGSRAGVASSSFSIYVVANPSRDYGAAVSVSASSFHVLVVNHEGRVFVSGDNTFAQSRLGYLRQPLPGVGGVSEFESIEPAFVTEFVEAPLPAGNWVSVAAVGSQSFAVRDDGSVWGWGSAGSPEVGIAGLGFETSTYFAANPQAVPGLADVRAVSFGDGPNPNYQSPGYGALALRSDGRVWGWLSSTSPPGPHCVFYADADDCLEFAADMRAIAQHPGSVLDVFLKSDRTVREHDQPVRGAPGSVVSIAVTAGHEIVMVAEDGTVWMKDDYLPQSAVRVPGLSDVVEVSVRSDSLSEIFARRRDGTVWSWLNVSRDGELHIGTPRQVVGASNIVALGGHYAISGDCGALWRMESDAESGELRALRVPGFGAGCSALTSNLSITVSGQGRMVSVPSGIDCDTSCNASFARGSEVWLLQAPDSGWRLDSANCGEGIELDGNDLIPLTSDLSCTVSFAAAGTRELALRVLGGGRVTSLPSGIDCATVESGDCRQSYSASENVTLTATAALGHRFDRYSGHVDCSDGALTMDDVRSCVAEFAQLPAPAAPTGFVAIAEVNGVRLRWDAVNGPVAAYRLERAGASGAYFTINGNLVGTASSAIDGTALSNSNYTYRLTAVNAGGESSPVSAVVTTLPPPPPPVQGWNELGSALSVTGEGPQSPSIAVDANGVPTVAYVETTGGVGRLFVRRFDGASWQILGGSALNPTSNTSASDPSLVLRNGEPRLAFSQGNGLQQNVYVVQFDGANWRDLAQVGGPLNYTAGSTSIRPSLVVSPNGRSSVAWVENAVVRVKTIGADLVAWDAYGGGQGPASANVDDVELAFDPALLPVVLWRETTNGMRELRAARGSSLQSIGSVAGPLPMTEIRDFGLIVETSIDPAGTPLTVFAQGVMPWSLRTRRFDDASWLQLPDVLTDGQTPLQAMSMHRSPTNQGVAYTYQSGGSGSGLFVFRREQGGWAAASTHLFLQSTPQLALAMASFASPVVAVVENDGNNYRLRVFRYFP